MLGQDRGLSTVSWAVESLKKVSPDLEDLMLMWLDPSIDLCGGAMQPATTTVLSYLWACIPI
jgi:hypothetical protein